MQTNLSSNPDSGTRRVSAKALAAAFRASMRRMPDTMTLVCLLTVWMIIDIWADMRSQSISDNVRIALWYLLGEGVLLSLTVNLWAEFGNWSGRRRDVIRAAGGTLLAADFVYLLFTASTLGPAAWVGRMAVTVALGVAAVFGPGHSIADRDRSWLYTYSLIANAVVCVVIELAMQLALSIIYFTVEMLFNVNSFESYLTMMALGCFLIPMIIFLSRIPRAAELRDNSETYRPGRFTVGLVKYLLLPLTVIYMAILYCYGLRILGALELPRGVVSLSVSGVTAAVVLTVFLLSGTCRGNGVFGRATRWLPLAMLPLLLLMSIAIFHRIGQYGITVPRLYVATFNLWAYAAMIWLAVRGAGRFGAVPVSFAGIFLLVSAIPGFNYTSLTNRYMHARAIAAFEQAGFSDFPLNRDQATEARRAMSADEWRTLSSRMEYLDDEDDHSAVADIIDFPAKKSSWQMEPPFVGRYDFDKEVEVISPLKTDLRAEDGIAIPAGYTNVYYDSNSWYSPECGSDGLCELILNDVCTLIVNPDSICRLDPDKTDLGTLRFDVKGYSHDEAVFIPQNLTCRYSDDDADKKITYLYIKGYIFTNQKLTNGQK